jgi:hypothetical protein
VKSPPNQAFLRLLLAYLIGVTVFSLVIALSFAFASLLHMSNVAGLIGGIVAIAAGIAAGWRTERALKRAFK